MFVSVILLVILLVYNQVTAQNCVLQNGKEFYDLSPLTISSGGAYGIDGTNGDGYYFFNICGEVNQGSCSPHQAVCQIGDAPHGCGDARDVTLEAMPDGAGVKLKYQSGERCYVMGGWERYVTINVFCDPNATSLRITEAREDPKCIYEIDTYSMHGCKHEVPQTPFPDPPVNIFLVVHSHDDVGWLDTMMEYYSSKVFRIISNIVEQLQQNEERKFVQVEQAFFVKWWEKADAGARDNVTKLVRNGQLKFPIGGWVMPDEATPSYSSLITQLTEGHQFLKRTFNVTPDVGWQIDPFGASHALAEIYKLSNFKGHVIDRIDWRVKNDLIANKSLQFHWRVSNYSNDLLTHVLDTLYCLPFNKGMKYTHELTEDEVVDNALYAIGVAKDKARWTRTPHVLVPVGCDFAFADRYETGYEFTGLDRIIKYVRENKEELNVIGIQYSTIDDYFAALHETDDVFPVYNGDFFPFDDKDNSWWTGYYTSRPELKGLIRKSESILRASESLFSTVNMISYFNDNETRYEIDKLVQAVSINLHHDAITGTAMVDVVEDYTDMLNTNLTTNYGEIESMLAMLTSTGDTPTLSLGDVANISQVTPVVIYNSLPWERHDYVKITIDNFDESLHYLVHCTDIADAQVITNYSGSGSSVLFFKVLLPPLGYETCFVTTFSHDERDIREEPGESRQRPSDNTINNNFLKIRFSDDDSFVEVKFGNSTMKFGQQFLVYQSYTGIDQKSGAYIFRTDDVPPFELSLSSHTDWVDGNVVSDVYQEFSYFESDVSVVTQHTRIFKDEDEYLGNFLEFSQTVGPLPEIKSGRELMARFNTSLKNEKTCFTDSNGLRFLERTYNPNMFLPLAGNHFPTVYASYFTDPAANVAVGFIWDRAHGFSCSYGSAQVMLHRRCQEDDARGLADHLNDDSVIDPVMRVVFGPPDEILNSIYRQMYLLNFRPIITIGTTDSEQTWTKTHVNRFSLLSKPLPPNIHMVDLKSLGYNSANNSQFILRLLHLFNYGEHKTLSSPVDLNMRDFFAEPYCITNMVETQLTANQEKELIHVNQADPPIITLRPKQFRTFIIDVTKDENNCANHLCGELSKCVDLKCTYTCECIPGTNFDPVAKTCVKEKIAAHSFSDIFFALSPVLPLALFAFFSFVCAYSIRSELAKIRHGHLKEAGGFLGRFMRMNRRGLEELFFPIFGPRDLKLK